MLLLLPYRCSAFYILRGLRFHRPEDREDFHEDARERLAASDEEPAELEAIGDYDTNPFLLTQAVPEVPVVASEGGQEAEQKAAKALRHLPQGLLNTGRWGGRP